MFPCHIDSSNKLIHVIIAPNGKNEDKEEEEEAGNDDDDEKEEKTQSYNTFRHKALNFSR